MPESLEDIDLSKYTGEKEDVFLSNYEDAEAPDFTLGRLAAGWHELKAWPSRQATSIRSQAEHETRQIEKTPEENLNFKFSQMTPAQRSRVGLKISELTADGNMTNQEAMRTAMLDSLQEEREYWRDIEESPAFQMPEEFKGQSSGLAEDVVRGFMGSLPDIAIGTLSLPVMMGSIYQHIQGQSYQALEEMGVEPERAYKASSISAGIQTPMEAIGNLIQLRAIFGAKGFTKWVVGVAESMFGEGVTEIAQQYPEHLAMFWAMHPDLSPQDMRGELLKQAASWDLAEEALYAGLVGALAGGVTTGAGGGVVMTLDKMIGSKQKLINEERLEKLRYLVNKFAQEDLNEADSRALKDILKAPEDAKTQELIEDIKRRVEFQEDIKGKGRDEVISGLKSTKKYTPDQVFAYMYIWDGVARSWAERNDKKPEQFYDDVLVGFKKSKVADVKGTTYQGKKGAIEFMGDKGQAVIHAFSAANPSTPIHETGHLIMDMVYREGSDDYLVAAKWAGVDEDRAMTGYDQWTTDEKEKVARAFEAYCMEGIAPTMRLHAVFQKMKQWLLNVYKSVKSLDVKLSDDIRRVFDRMVASDIELQNDPIPMEVSGWMQVKDVKTEIPLDQMESYADVQAEAGRRVAKELQARRKKEQKKIRTALMKEAKASIEEDPIYAMLDDLRASGGFKLGELYQMYDQEYVNDLLRRIPGLVSAKGEAKPDTFGMRYGYFYPDELIEEIKNSKTKQEAVDDYFESLWNEYQIGLDYENVSEHAKVIDEEINILNEMLLKERPTPAQVATHAIFKGYENILNAADELHETELRRIHQEMKAEEDRKIEEQFYKFMERKRGYEQEILSIKTGAKGKIDEQKQKLIDDKKKKLQELRGKQAERILKLKEQQRARIKAIRARAKETQAKRKIHGKINRYIRNKTTIDKTYKAQLIAIVRQYGYLIPKRQDIPPTMSFEAFVQELESTDEYAAENLRNEVAELPPIQKKGKLRLEQLDQIVRVADMLSYLGKEAKKVASEERKAEHNKKIASLIITIQKTWGEPEEGFDRPTPPSARQNKWKRMQQGKARYSAELQKAEFILRALDGWQDFGPNQNEIFQPIKKAEDAEGELGVTFVKKFNEIFGDNDLDRAWAHKKFEVGLPEMWTKEEIFCVALNTGNAQNKTAIREGYNLTDEQIATMLKVLDEKEWDAIRAVWDVLDELYPYLNDIHKKLTGVTLPKVKGKYYPLKWDRELSWTAQTFAAKAAKRDMFVSSAYSKSHVEAGHRVKRTGGKLPPLLSLSVIAEHMTKAIHDVTHQIPVKQAQRLINDASYRVAVTEALGKEVYTQLQPWLNYVARPQREPQSQIEKWIGRLRRNATVVGLGLKVTVAQKQMLSLTQTIDELGLVEVSKALKQFWTSPYETSDFIKNKSTMIRFRRKQWHRELAEFASEFDPTRSAVYGELRDAFFWMIKMMDIGATYPSWIAGYNAGMARFKGDETKAIEFADGVVRRTQPVASPKDLADIQRGGELKRTMVMFYTFFNVFQNRMVQLRRMYKTGHINTLEAFKSYWWLMMVPAMAAFVIQKRRLPEGPLEAIKNLISYRLAGLPFIRDIANPILSGFDYSLTPVESGLEAPTDLMRAFLAKKDPAWKAIMHGTKLAGYLVGLPAAQMVITMDGILDLMSGETQNPARLLFREEYKKKKQTARRR